MFPSSPPHSPPSQYGSPPSQYGSPPLYGSAPSSPAIKVISGSTKKFELKATDATELKRVNLCDSPDLFEQIRSIFNGTLANAPQPTIASLYGDQSVSLRKIQEGCDRTTELWIDDNDTVHGLLVYKNEAQSEFEKYGTPPKYLEIKTLFRNKTASENPGLGQLLIDRVDEVAKEKLYNGVGVTVSHGAQEALTFFKRHGYAVHTRLDDPYDVGNDEYVLFKPAAG